MEQFDMSATFPVSPEEVYRAWLDSDAHGEMTGSPAEIDPAVGGAFSAWEGYITGKTLELVPGKKIVQEWRTTEFPEGSPPSLLTLVFEAAKTGTRLRLSHNNIPDGQAEEYKTGWEDFYFTPMKEYFQNQ
jgi:activator of HSP90 ATPase